MRTLIVDDEPIARQLLIEELREQRGVELVGEAGDGRTALALIRSLRPALVLLDIQMPVMTGFEVLERLDAPLPPAVIFVTAYDRYALRAFEVGAVDYLLKPVSAERLAVALGRAHALIAAPRESSESLARTLDAYAAQTGRRSRRIVGRRGREYYLLDPAEILYFRADGEIVWITTPRHRYMATTTLQAIEEKLAGSAFRRVHRGALVNMDHVQKAASLSNQRWLLTLSNGDELTVSKRQAHTVQDMLDW